jgi:hypothetical protein
VRGNQPFPAKPEKIEQSKVKGGKMAVGLARLLPAMSGAVPWAASKSATRTTAAGARKRTKKW